jgi:chemotaxis protein MotB
MSSGPRYPGDERDHSSERWLVSYADFITLMFAFFAILYATSQKDIEKAEEFQESIKKYLIKAGAMGESGQQINQGTKDTSVLESPIQTFNAKKPEAVATEDEAENFMDVQLTPADRNKYVIDISSDDWGTRIILSGGAIFADGSGKFRSEALPFMSKLSQLIAKTKRKVLIEGHVAPGETGGMSSSWEFASSRAANVLRFIQKKEAMGAERLAMASLGDSRPLAGARDPALRSRIEVVILNPDYEF